MGDWAIRVKDLRKEYRGRSGPVHAVNGIDLEIGQGECFGLLGPQRGGQDDDRRDPRGPQRADVG